MNKELIRQQMKELNITYDDLAHELGVGRTTVWRYLNKKTYISLAKYNKIKEILKIN